MASCSQSPWSAERPRLRHSEKRPDGFYAHNSAKADARGTHAARSDMKLIQEMIMSATQQTCQPDNKPKRDSALRDERLQQLMESCQQEVLRQIIGPFGLTPAMFEDKDGGNVATIHNAEKSVFPDELHKENYAIANEKYGQKIRQQHWDDKKARGETYKEINQTIESGQDALSAATHRPMTKGEINGDHTVSLKEAHEDKNLHLRFTEEERKNILNNKKNMAFIEEPLNKSKGKKTWDECLSDPGFIKKNNLTPEDAKRIKENDKESRSYIQGEKNKRLAGELLSTGAKESGKNAFRQALGVVLHEFVTGSFSEIKTLLKDYHNEQNLIDRLIESLRRVMNRVINKLKATLEAAFQGGVQGFISNLLTFLINNLITTSEKIVTIIRESMQSLWKAIKLMVNPPEGMPALEVTREVTKIIAAVVTTGLGMLMEESVKGFIMSIPVLAPIADVLATALTAIITGIAGALIIYGIDQLFDWLSSIGTELLAAQEAHAEEQTIVVGRLQTWLNLQFENSRLFEVCVAEYQQIQQDFAAISLQMETATIEADASIQARNLMIETVETQIERKKRLEAMLRSI